MSAFCLSRVKWLVTKASTPPGLKSVDGLREEEIVERHPVAGVLKPHVGEGDVADDGVDLTLGQACVLEVLDADVLVRMQGPGDAARDEIEFDADEVHPLGARLRNRPGPQPGSSTVALGGTPSRVSASNIARMTVLEV